MPRTRRPRCSSCGIHIQRGNEGFGGWVWFDQPHPWTKIELCRDCTPQAVVDIANAARQQPTRRRIARRETAMGLTQRYPDLERKVKNGQITKTEYKRLVKERRAKQETSRRRKLK